MADVRTSEDGTVRQATDHQAGTSVVGLDAALATALLDQQHDVTLLIDQAGLINYVSRSILHVAGQDPDQIVGSNIVDHLHPSDVENITRMYLRFNEDHDGDPPQQFRVQFNKGNYIWCEARVAHFDHPDFPDHALVNLREINHYQRLLNNLNTGERAIGVGSWRWDFHCELPDWSDGMFHLAGLEPGPVTPSVEEAYQMWHPQDRERVGAILVDAINSHCNFDTIARMRHSDGHYLTARIYGFVECDASDNPIALIGIVHDITRQARIEEALRESERHYRIIIDQASDLIARYDNIGRCTFMSPGGCTMFGLEAKDFVGYGPLRNVVREDRASVVEVFSSASRQDSIKNLTFRARHKDGSILWLEANVRFLYDEDNDLEEVIIVARDITERKATEDNLRTAREKAEAANRTKSRFLANMSHELRTPLNAIIGFSDLMCEEMFGPLGSEQYVDYSKLIRESGQFLLDLINDILDMSKVEAGKFQLYLEEIRFARLVDSSCRIVHQRVREKDISLRCFVDPDLPDFHADERAVKQILLNLLSNAAKFTPEGGRVQLVAVRHEDAVHVTVTDTGIGIPEDALPRLAQPFEQVVLDPGNSQGGSGLGLALVKSFVTMHGGMFDIESQYGEGTKVSFTLPLRRGGEERQIA